MGGVHWESLLDLILFDIFMYNLGDKIECHFIKSADDTRLGGDVDMLQEEPPHREILTGWPNLPEKNCMRFNKDKC